MMKRRPSFIGKIRESSGDAAAVAKTTTSSAAAEEDTEWELRPGGMLVQKRTGKKDASLAPNLRVRVAYCSFQYEISVNPQATFGELKKLLTAETGLQPDEQRVVFRGKDRENGDYLDTCGVKDRSKLILIEDPSSRERRFVEMRRNAKIQSVHRALSGVSTEIDRLAEQVRAIEKSISNGAKVPEVQITTLIEMLMRQALKLESISAAGEAASQKNLQGRRVQKCVETLDVLKASNARVKAPVVTTKWETFDPPPSPTAHWQFFE